MSDIIDESLPLDTDLAGYGAKDIRNTRLGLNKFYTEYNSFLSSDYRLEGKSLKIIDSYVAISAAHPWLCLSLPDVILDTKNYSESFITERRSRKIVYDELNTNVSAFGGTWSGNVFTLTNNTANNAMIAELAEDWLFAGSPTTNWRILNDGTNEFNIIGISASARTITVNLDSKTTIGTSITIYLYRVYESLDSCRHFSWAGLGLYMTGQNKITGLRRRDKMQQITGALNLGNSFTGFYSMSGAFQYGAYQPYLTQAAGGPGYNAVFDSAYSPNARTGSKTEIESSAAMLYLYVGAYTL